MAPHQPLPELLPRQSHVVRSLRRRLERVADADVPVLLQGETGTGKTLVARHIHAASRRRDRPMVGLNCAGIPEALFESELFGHVRGAFTGAARERSGLIRQAGGGTLFLDEVGELPPGQQAKLLTALEERTIRPVGSDATLEVDFRLVSATCRPLADAVADGDFRRDLFHRLALLHIELLPLRQRPDDILPLARRFLRQAAARHGLGDRALGDDAVVWLREQRWPGNIRELAHTVEAAAILSSGPLLDAAILAEASPRG
jgi:DNA-binding NtrC family response regulator